MKIYTKAGELPFETFTFPDGQPHFKLLHRDEWAEATVELAIASPYDLIMAQLVSMVLHQIGYKVNLDVRYLMGARMDRAINAFQPFTLQMVAAFLNARFDKVRFLDIHSSVALDLVYRSSNVLPVDVVKKVLTNYSMEKDFIVIPDKGAAGRVHHIMDQCRPGGTWQMIQSAKTRNMNTGHLTGFKADGAHRAAGRQCLIIDDICDGGGTFTGLANVLREAGAKSVDLFVTHGIFSKGLPLNGIDTVYTTDSYPRASSMGAVVFPISMKDIK